MKAMTIRLKDDFYKLIKKILIDKDISFQQYVLDLIEKDINKDKRSD